MPTISPLQPTHSHDEAGPDEGSVRSWWILDLLDGNPPLGVSVLVPSGGLPSDSEQLVWILNDHLERRGVLPRFSTSEFVLDLAEAEDCPEGLKGKSGWVISSTL